MMELAVGVDRVAVVNLRVVLRATGLKVSGEVKNICDYVVDKVNLDIFAVEKDDFKNGKKVEVEINKSIAPGVSVPFSTLVDKIPTGEDIIDVHVRRALLKHI